MTELVEPPPGQVFVAASFPIVQFDEHGDPKIRRGEDWRRSGHNSTVKADDVPTHHFVGDFVDMARRFVAMDVVPLVLGHDLLSAYRQWAVKVPAHCGTFLPTRHGVTLWFHLAMCFGAAASVWNFNRAGDALQVLLRQFLLIVGGHYVDDFNAVDFPETAQSAFDAFADLFALLGLRTKPSKAQEPGTAHVVQGVTFQVRRDGVELRPTESRVAKLLAAIESALVSNRLAPAAAQRLAGKLTFLTQATFGAVGKAALKPVYARASDTSATSDDELSVGLRSALRALAALLRRVQPRFFPFAPDSEPFAVLYADAFFQEGDLVHKAGFVPTSARASPRDRWNNGWGFVLRVGARVLYSRGRVPSWFLKHFAARKAFIYVLEILAQVFALVAFGRRLPRFWLAYIDNVAGQFALLKGYGRDASVNGVLAAFWASAARFAWFPQFRRVPSKANVSDAVSRDDLSKAQELGWEWVDVPDEAIMIVLAKAAVDVEYASDMAGDDLAAVSDSWEFR